MSRIQLAAVITGVVGTVTAAVVPTYIVTTNSTERMRACVENGGEYVTVPNTTKMECQK